MELPPIKSRVLSIRVKPTNRDQATNHSRVSLDKNNMSMEIYRLKGNDKTIYLQEYTNLMKKYMEIMSESKVIKNIRKELLGKKIYKGFNAPNRLRNDFNRKYRLSSTPNSFY